MKPSASVIRFLLEAGFLILIAACAGIAHLAWYGIILVMAVAWGLVALVERTAARAAPGAQAPFGGALAAEGVNDERAASETAVPETPRGGSFWNRAPSSREAAVPPPSHVTVLPADAPALDLARAAEPPESVEVPATVEPVGPTVAETTEVAAETPPQAEEVVGEAEPEPGPAPGSEPVAETPAAAEPEPPAPPTVAPVAPEPASEPVPVPPELRAVPVPPPPPVAATPPVAEVRDAVLPFVSRGETPREWNLWDLERVAREEEGRDVGIDEERAFLLMNLRQFASSDGILPESFDALVREAFGPSLAGRR